MSKPRQGQEDARKAKLRKVAAEIMADAERAVKQPPPPTKPRPGIPYETDRATPIIRGPRPIPKNDPRRTPLEDDDDPELLNVSGIQVRLRQIGKAAHSALH